MQKLKRSPGQLLQWIALFLLLSFKCHSQSLPDPKTSLDNYSQSTLQEKLFVHTDRQNYLAGGIIWFKIYAADGMYNKPLNLSKVAYVEILDNGQVPVLQAKIKLINGSGNGSLVVPVSIANGNYKLRAYTNWMKNFSAEYYFEKAITIVNTLRSPDVTLKQNKAAPDIAFFPEGGNLISGIKSRVAFKAVGSDGKGINFTGALIDRKNDTITKFSPQKFGMGSFEFTPVKNNTYRAVMQTSGGSVIVKPLPAALTDGYALQLTDNGTGGLDVAISSNSMPNGNVYILVHTRQVVKLARETNLFNGVAHVLINKSLLGYGISHITVFNGERQAVCERLYFKRPADTLWINARPNKNLYDRRAKVDVTLSAKNAIGGAVDADLSMSVYRLDAYQAADPTDILSYLWLSSDLQGSIEMPGYYFFDKNADAAQAADNLMLTQGWRRFDWKKVASDKKAAFAYLPEIYGHLVAGKVINTLSNEPAGGIVAYLAVPGKTVQLFTAKSDSTGALLFNTKNLSSTEIVVQTNNQQDSTYRLDILKPFSEQYSKTAVPPFYLNPEWENALKKENFNAQVLNSYFGDKLKQFYQPGPDSSGFYKRPVNSYLLDNYTRFTTMEEVLREYIREAGVRRSRGKFHIKVTGPDGVLDGDPLVMIDGIPVFNIDKVIAADPLVIRKLEVVPQKYQYGPQLQEGIFSLTSYKGDGGGVDIDPRALIIDYEGLQNQRVFYSPVYQTEQQVNSTIPDFRHLLYWSPSVKANGKSPVSFYTSDLEGRYIGIIQGIGSNGEAGAGAFVFEVKK